MMNNPRDISIDEFDYLLPDARIASHPLEQRDSCKLLVADSYGRMEERVFSELPVLLPDETLLVYNNTRVINARLRFTKETGANIEVFCLEPHAPADYAVNFACTDSCEWICLIGNLKRWKSGDLRMEVTVDGESAYVTATRVMQAGNAWVVRFSWSGGFTFARIIEAAGEIPIPPYLNRDTEQADSRDYQTIYSHIDGSVAAPTAGLHFTPGLLERIADAGISRAEVTLHVGAGTFQPVKSDVIGDHPMHSEFIAVRKETIEAILSALKDKRHIAAVGTTTVRTLESLYHIGCLIYKGEWSGELPQWYPYETSHPDLSAVQALETIERYLDDCGLATLIADTRIIIAPGYIYRIVDTMITNFHQPRSTLLLLVSAFIGTDKWRPVYDYALSHDFRFLSYGDACLFYRK